MALAFPYVYISCPCSEKSRQILAAKRASREVDRDDGLEEEEKTFDPRHPRSAFSLLPPEHLLYCEECHDIKCPRCITEEIICWYCPSCLFEAPSSMVKSEGNRCTRNCFSCPICTSQLITACTGDTKDGPFILNCNYCMWTTLDVGITFGKPTNIRGQLDRLANGGKSKQPWKADSTDPSRKSSLAREPFSPSDVDADTNPHEKDGYSADLDPTARFNALRSFYKDQITASSTDQGGLPTSALDLAYASPSSLARLMDRYSNIGKPSTKKSRQKPHIMREALSKTEGLQVSLNGYPPSHSDYIDTASSSQLALQHPSYLGNPTADYVSDLRPMPTLLRTKRSKRCAECKHILVKPEFKPTSTRYRIKLIALNYIPFITLKPVPVPGGLRPPGPDGTPDMLLDPGNPSQWIMTLRNPLFEDVTVTLGSPAVTPGRHAHKVTILCPQFEIGKNGDVWDDALNNPLNKSVANTTATGNGEQIAGKLYDQGRNWASVVIEIVPALIAMEVGMAMEEDEDVIEVPIRVRLEWTVSEEGGGRGEGGEGEEKTKKKSEKALEEAGEGDDGRRELAYWMVLGVGRVVF